MKLQLIIVDPNYDFCEAARRCFKSHSGVEVVQGRFEELPHFDCIVTAGNSFGLMDAGIDRAILTSFGEDIQKRIQAIILEDFLGEQPVGTSILVPTGSSRFPFVAHSPTMRVPLNIDQTDNVYQAMWATLTAIHRHNRVSERKIEILACPGLGTGTGGMEPTEAALQIKIAYEHFLNPPEYLNGSVAQYRHERVHYGSRWGFRNPRKFE